MGERNSSPALHCGEIVLWFPGGSAWHLAYVLGAAESGEALLRIIGPGREGEACSAPLRRLRQAHQLVRPARGSPAPRRPGTMLAGEWAIYFPLRGEGEMGLVQLLEDALDRAGSPVNVVEYRDGALHARAPIAPGRLMPLADVVDELCRRFEG